MLELGDVRRARHAPGLLRTFNDAGLLAAADVHVAVRIAALGGETDEAVILAAALAVRAPRLGHVLADIASIRETAAVESEEPVDLSALPWPDVGEWLDKLRASPLVAVGEEPGETRPLRLVGSALYLDRYWREEVAVASDLRAFGPAAVDEGVLADGLSRLFDDDGQAAAAEAAVRRRFAVVAGGPGTGKTTTVARIVALLCEQAAEPPLVALAAPTGKAQSRLQEAVHDEAERLDVSPRVREVLRSLEASTLHRLLGWRPDSHSRFKHNRANRLPHDVVIVDETSMVSLSMMARLVEAVRPDARLVLVGDPGQLTSIEAGAVLGDIVSAGGEGVVVLERVYRFGAGIDALAAAVRAGDADAAIAALQAGHDDLQWIAVDPGDPASAGALAPVQYGAIESARKVLGAARRGEARAAIEALGAFRVLCAHRRGAHGVSVWNARIEGWLTGELDRGRWYVGRPLLVTENDYGLRLFNGDTGAIVAGEDGRAAAAFERGTGVALLPPARLGAVDTVYAMTVHKAQGSQFGTAAVLLPPASSQVLTRELLYTAVTRARKRLILAGTEATIRAAIARPVARASGLAARIQSPA